MAKTRKTELDVDDSLAQTIPTTEPEVKKGAPPSEPEKKEEKPERKKLTPRLKILIIAGLVSAVIIMAAITALLVFGGSEKTEEPVAEVVAPEPEPEPEPESEPEPEIELKKLENLHMEPFMITYKTPQGEQFLRIGLVLQLSNKDAKAEIDQNLVIVRDAIFFFLKRKELKDFNVLKRKKELLLELKRLLDRSIQNGRVDKVMITEMNIY